MTIDLDSLEALLAEATQEHALPWTCHPTGTGPVLFPHKPRNRKPDYGSLAGFTIAERDFIIAVCNAAPSLLAELRELRKKVNGG